MFSNDKKARAKITDKDPVFKVRYIGATETFVASGKGCAQVPVQKLWDNAGEEKDLKKVSILITVTGITLRDLEKKKSEERHYRIEDISFCNADTIINDRLFSWICKNPETKKLDCHAVLCSSKEKAKSMALVLSRAFQIAYKDWKANQVKQTRENKKHSGSDGTGGASGFRTASGKLSVKAPSNGDSNDRLLARKDSQCQTDVCSHTGSLSESECSSVSDGNTFPTRKSMDAHTSMSINGSACGGDDTGHGYESARTVTPGATSDHVGIQAQVHENGCMDASTCM
jgi:hypothetical protein